MKNWHTVLAVLTLPIAAQASNLGEGIENLLAAPYILSGGIALFFIISFKEIKLKLISSLGLLPTALYLISIFFGNTAGPNHLATISLALGPIIYIPTGVYLLTTKAKKEIAISGMIFFGLIPATVMGLFLLAVYL